MTFAADVAAMDAMIFDANGQGEAATYLPLAGGSSPIYVIVQRDVESRPDAIANRATDKNVLIWIQRSDVNAPVKGDRIAITGGDTYQVSEADSQDEFISKLRVFLVR